MTGYRRGDVVLVPFPFTDFSTFKQRPALVISSNAFNHIREDAIVVALTSHIEASGKGNNYLIKGAEQERARLPMQGVVLVGKIITIEQRLIRRTLGTVSQKAISEIAKRITKIIG